MNAQYQPSCKVCERGVLVPKKIYRMSGPVVVIGFIFLIPCILGMLLAALLFTALVAPNVIGVAVYRTGFITTIALGLGISSFVGGLLGWLLVMKKRVLQCSVCGATVSAS
jgi:hypothetical protein